MKIYELIETSSSFFLISEYLEGGELFDRIVEHQNFSEKNAAAYIKDVLLALAYLHNEGIVHRDLKPENILFENRWSNSNLKLIDFGISTNLKPD